MSWNPNDYDGITNASEARDYAERMDALADARDAAREAELRAEALECAENDEAEEREIVCAQEAIALKAIADAEELAAWKRANPIERVLADLRRAAAAPRLAAIGNGLFVRVGDGKRKRRAA